MYSTSKFPLVIAFDDFVKLSNNSRTIVEWLEQAKSDDVNQEFAGEIKRLATSFKEDYFERIQEIMLALKADPNFMLEMQLSQSEENVRSLKGIDNNMAVANLINILKPSSNNVFIL